MCVVSMIGDFYKDRWSEPYYVQTVTNWPQVSKEDFDALKKEVLEMKKLLKKAIKYDEENGEPHCEMEDKVELLRKVAELVGVDLEELIPKSVFNGTTGTTWNVTQ